LVQGDEGPAQVVQLGHRGTPSVICQRHGAISFAACPIPSRRWREMDSNPRSPVRKTARKRRSRSLTNGKCGRVEPGSPRKAWRCPSGIRCQRVRRFRRTRHPSPHRPAVRRACPISGSPSSGANPVQRVGRLNQIRAWLAEPRLDQPADRET
jgi:hypothetical protein